jgi:hypothetical protein
MWRAFTLMILVGAGLMITAACDDLGDKASEPDPADDVATPAPADEVPETDSDDDASAAVPDDLFGEEVGSFATRPILPWYMRPPVFHLATDQDELETGWEMYHIEGDFPDVDWDEQAVMFLGLAESGSCPWEFSGLSTRDDDLLGHLVYDLDHPDDQEVGCTADDNPRTFVVSIDRESVAPDAMTVRLVHDEFDYYPMRTDTRDMPLKSIDATRHDYPFVIWESEPNNGQEPRDRIVKRIEVIARDEATITLRMGFPNEAMLPDLNDPSEFELALPDDSYAFTRVGMIVHDASLTFEPPENPDVYVAPYREIAVAGRDFHEMMSRPMISFSPHLGNVDHVTSVEVAIPLDEHPDAYEWGVSVLDDEPAIELTITQRE